MGSNGYRPRCHEVNAATSSYPLPHVSIPYIIHRPSVSCKTADGAPFDKGGDHAYNRAMSAAGQGPSRARALYRRWEWLAVAAITLVAAFLRLYRLDTLPPGVHFDEAVYGLQGEYIYRGHLPVFFQSYTGREPLYMYLVALVYLFTGPGTFGLRLTSALIGIATVPMAYLAFRAMFGRRVALLGALLTATAYWHLNVTRTGFCWTLMPLMEAIAIYLLWRGYSEGKIRFLVLGGVATALNLYIYLAARFFPITLFLILVYLALVDAGRLRVRWPGLLLALGAAVLVFAPLGIHYLRVPHDFWERADQVLAWKQAGPESYGRTIAGNVLHMFLTFLPRLDTAGRFSLQGRPAFDPLIGPFFLLGVVCALRQLRQPQYGVLVLWWLGMALPPLFTIEPYPVSNQRIFGTIPALYGLAALGFAAVWSWAKGRLQATGASVADRGRSGAARLVPIVLGLVLLAEAVWGAVYYFAVWAPSQATYYKFHSDVAEIGRLMRPEVEAGHRVVIASEHYHHPSVVITEPASVDAKWVQGKRVVALPAWDGREIDYFVPIFDAKPIAPGVDVLERAACQKEEFQNANGVPVVELYRICRPPAISRPATPLATFADEVRLWSVDVASEANRGSYLRVGLQWEVLKGVRAERFFAAHVVDSQGVRWAQADEIGYLPPEWQAGDQVWQWLDVPLPPGIPPATYQVRVILAGEKAAPLLVHDSQGALAGTYVAAGTVRLGEEPRWIERPRPQAPAFGPLRAWEWAPLSVERRPGEQVLAEVTWQAAEPVTTALSAEFDLCTDSGQSVAHWSYPLASEYPATRWQQGEVVRQRYLLSLPPDMPEGCYVLQLSVTGQDGRLSLGEVRVAGIARLMAPPPMQHSFASPPYLGDRIRLLGYDLDERTWSTGEPVRLTLFWQALAPIENDYAVFVHLLNERGEIVVQRDIAPADGSRPTRSWIADEVVIDAHVLPPTPARVPGSYRLVLGMYDPTTLARLEVRHPEAARVSENRFILAELQVR